MRKILFCCITVLFLGTSLWAQESDDFDDFESLFDEVTDIVVEDAANLPAATEPYSGQSATAGNITFSGSTTSNLGGKITWEDGVWDASPGATLSSSLDFAAKVDSTTSVHGSFSAGFPGDLQFSVSSLYLDYFAFDTYVTIGRRGNTWGNTRIFSGANLFIAQSEETMTAEEKAAAAEAESKLAAQGYLNTNIVSDSGNGMSILLRRSTRRGELALLGYTDDFNGYSMDTVNAAFCYDTNIGLTGLTVLGRSYGFSSSEPYPVIGLEEKRTVAGFDIYAQELCRIDYDTWTVPAVVLTAGFYRLWFEKTPHFGLNVEVQDSWLPEDGIHHVRIGADAGFKRLGSSGLGKIGLSGNWNFADTTGSLTLAFIRSELIRHGDFMTAITADYSGSGIAVSAATTLAFSISY
ncbi:MAG: hypothetical protein MJ178_03660 [Treponemataceae bacterium]|nr:hypothetical protein [Treponemataceae bacterium]